jgi:hypothetical protein
MKKPKHAKGHQAIHNLGAYAHPPKTEKVTRVGPLPHQVGNKTAKMGKGTAVPPGNVSKPKTRKVAHKLARMGA